jgi:hypothetical protein
LFSQPPPVAIGETNKYPKIIPEREEGGTKPATAPRNFYTGSLLKGKVEGHRLGGKTVSCYFEKAGFNLDKYVEKKFNEKDPIPFIGDNQFKPQSAVTH